MQKLNQILDAILKGGVAPASDWPDTAPSPEWFGCKIVDGQISLAQRRDLLNITRLQEGLPNTSVHVDLSIGSTNASLLQAEDIHRSLVTAECQLAGRGRRGRNWSSPFAKNLAFSYGHKTNRQSQELGGLSLIVGLAIAESLNTLGAVVQVKWPNDVVVGEQKLCGILVELLAKGGHSELVIGVGVNVDLDAADKAQIDRDVCDIRSLGIKEPRTDLLVHIVQTLQQFLDGFETTGFEPFIDAFNASHVYHGKTCEIHQGNTIITGQVEGVDLDGALILSTENGIRSFHGGEVSLRAT